MLTRGEEASPCYCFYAYRVDAHDAVAYSRRQMTPQGTTLPDFPANLLEFQRMFPDEGRVPVRYLEQVRWPKGFVLCWG
jgi:hypothetical protein